MSLPKTYTNPVVRAESADPFVLKFLKDYWCYCTGRIRDGRCFPIFLSSDLVGWTESGAAMDPLQDGYSEYWAPEVTYWRGHFYMYYSAGDGNLMHIRCAVADMPGGPFIDSGHRLTSEEFAIDPHLFHDDDGSRWLFYATDFLEHTHIGTGTVRDRLVDPFTLSGNPVAVVRAQYGWQLFDPSRQEKGGVRWHTVEGPAVLKNKGIYYEMFSGGNWKNSSYGVGYAVANTLESADEWTQVCDGIRVLPVLATIPGVTGPGHNSVVLGPDNRQFYCAYHRWSDDGTMRQLAIDPLEWIGQELSIFGPSNAPRPVPNLPRSLSEDDWAEIAGEWVTAGRQIHQQSTSTLAEMRCRIPIETGVGLECGIRLINSGTGTKAGFAVRGRAGQCLFVCVSPERDLSVLDESQIKEDALNLPHSSNTMDGVMDILRLDVTGRVLHLSSSNTNGSGGKVLFEGIPEYVGLFTKDAAAEFSGLSLTRGWRDLFEEPRYTLMDLGYESEGGAWGIHSMQLFHRADESGAIFKRVPSGKYEFVVNARLDRGEGRSYGFFPSSPLREPGLLVVVVPRSDRWVICADRTGGRGAVDAASVLAELPASFDVHEYQQFSFTLDEEVVSIRWRAKTLAVTPIDIHGERVGLFAAGSAAFDMVRVTELSH